MKSSSKMEWQEIQVELKYCERCGGLWLRLQGNGGVYCASCDVRLQARPDPGGVPMSRARRRKRREQETDLRTLARIDLLQGVAAVEVRI
jgi:uncharacterized Zn finger protein (UPF0148 family)